MTFKQLIPLLVLGVLTTPPAAHAVEPNFTVDHEFAGCHLDGDGGLVMVQSGLYYGQNYLVFDTKTGRYVRQVDPSWATAESWWELEGLAPGGLLMRRLGAANQLEEAVLDLREDAVRTEVVPGVDGPHAAPNENQCAEPIRNPNGGWLITRCTEYGNSAKPILVAKDGKRRGLSGGMVRLGAIPGVALNGAGTRLAFQHRIYDLPSGKVLRKLYRTEPPGESWGDDVSDEFRALWIGDDVGLWYRNAGKGLQWVDLATAAPTKAPFPLPDGSPCDNTGNIVIFAHTPGETATWLTAIDMSTGEMTALVADPPEKSFEAAIHLAEVETSDRGGVRLGKYLLEAVEAGLGFEVVMDSGRTYEWVMLPENPEVEPFVLVKGSGDHLKHGMEIPQTTAIGDTGWSATRTRFGSSSGGNIFIEARVPEGRGVGLLFDVGPFSWENVSEAVRIQSSSTAQLYTAASSMYAASEVLEDHRGNMIRLLNDGDIQGVLYEVPRLRTALDELSNQLGPIHKAKGIMNCEADQALLEKMVIDYETSRLAGHRFADLANGLASTETLEQVNRKLPGITDAYTVFDAEYETWSRGFKRISDCGN
jgi:hypothetical protein